MQLDQLQIRTRGYIDRRDDLGDAVHIARVVGDDKNIATRVGTNEVVWRDQRPQNLGQLGGTFVLQHEHLRDDSVARNLGTAIDHATRCLGVDFRHDLDNAAFLDRRVAMHPQRRNQDLVGDVLAHRRRGNDVHGARYARIDDEGFAGVSADGFDHRRDIGVDETECDAFLGRGRRLDNHECSACGEGQ